MARPLFPYLLVSMLAASASAWNDYNSTAIVDDHAALIQIHQDQTLLPKPKVWLWITMFVGFALYFLALPDCESKKIKPPAFWGNMMNPGTFKKNCQYIELLTVFVLVADFVLWVIAVIDVMTSNKTLLQLASDNLVISDAADLVLGVFRGHGDAVRPDRRGQTPPVEAAHHVFGDSSLDELTSKADTIVALVPDGLRERTADLARTAQSASMPIEPVLKSRAVALLQEWNKFCASHEGLVRELAGSLSNFPERHDHYKGKLITSNLPSTTSTWFAAGYRIGKTIERL